MFSSVKTKVVISVILLWLVPIQGLPGMAMAYDVQAFIKEFAGSQAKVSDEIIKKKKLKIKGSVNKLAGWYENKWLGGISFLENKTGLNEQYKLFKALKNYNLLNLGFNSGVVKGAGDLTAELYSLVAMIPTVPERLINFGFNYTENPKKYQDMVTNGAIAVTGVVLNPLPHLSGLKNTYLEATKDPVKLGNLHGEATAFLGSFLIGGGQVKTFSTISKVTQATQLNKVEIPLGVATNLKKTGVKGMRLEFNIAGIKNVKKKDADTLINIVKEKTYLNAEKAVGHFELKISKVLERRDKKLPKEFTMDDLDLCYSLSRPVPMTKEAVELVAKAAGIGFDGINIEIIRIPYILNPKMIASCFFPHDIRLYPGAFRDVRTLVEVLGHERTHWFQFKLYNINTVPKLKAMRFELESAAYRIYGQWLDNFALNYAAHFKDKPFVLDQEIELLINKVKQKKK